MKTLSVVCLDASRREQARDCAARLGLSLQSQLDVAAIYSLIFEAEQVVLRHAGGAHNDIRVDFLGGRAAHRRQYGGGKGQLIAKAVGIKGTIRPHVWDATAGLGGDAFVLATLGCTVTLSERHPAVAALLADGLHRARQQGDPQSQNILQRMLLETGDSITRLTAATQTADVVYVDPMFPPRTKSANVKKEMQAFHALVGEDGDAETLLDVALRAATYRVVVKRPRLAPAIGGPEPSFVLEGKSSRFDIYALRRFEC